jgi:pSer/pThr/pTyr-binding forkhead associated (FHA) protein
MAKALKLRFVAGKYEGGEFRLPPEGEVLIGRGAELPVVLAEDMVSRKHARLTIHGEQVRIEDLGSTNGTFVNGERVKSAELKAGDRVLIGTSIMKLLTSEAPEARPRRASATMPPLPGERGAPRVSSVPPAAPPTTQAPPLPPRPPRAQPHTTIGPQAEVHRPERSSTGSVKTVAGSIEEIPLPDILQLFAASRKTGLLVVKGPNTQRANLYIENGQVVLAQLDGVPALKSRKVINRVLRWKTGTFELRPQRSVPAGERMTESMEHLLMDGLRELDEIERLRPDLPPDETKLVLLRPMTSKLRELLPSTLDILQAVHNAGTVAGTMDGFPDLADLDVAMEIVLLVQKGYIKGE